MIAVGMMSGTSVDGIDIAAIEQEAAGEPELELGSQPRGSTNLIR